MKYKLWRAQFAEHYQSWIFDGALTQGSVLDQNVSESHTFDTHSQELPNLGIKHHLFPVCWVVFINYF